MRRVFPFPARYAPEVEAAIAATLDRLAREEAAPGTVLAPFMVEPRRKGEGCLVVVLPEITQEFTVAQGLQCPQVHVA